MSGENRCDDCDHERVPEDPNLDCAACVEWFVEQIADKERREILALVQATKAGSSARDPGDGGWQAACDCLAELIANRGGA